MANELDELTGPVNAAGRDINVIEKQIPVTVGTGSPPSNQSARHSPC